MDASTDRNLTERALGWAAVPAAVFVIVLMLHTVVNAVARTSGHPIQGTLEISGFWYMPVVAFLGFVVAQQRGEHIEATLLFDRMSPRMQREFLLAGHVLVLALCLVLTWFGWWEAVDATSIGRTSGSSSVPIWPMTFAVPVGYALISVQLVVEIVRVLRHGPDERSRQPSDADRDRIPDEVAP